MFTDPDGYIAGLLGATAVFLSKVGFDRVRGNGHVTKADLAGLASADDMADVKGDVSDLKADITTLKEDFSEVKGWLKGRFGSGEPPR